MGHEPGFISAFAGRYRTGWLVVRCYPRRVEVACCKGPDGIHTYKTISQFYDDRKRQDAIHYARRLIARERRHMAPDVIALSEREEEAFRKGEMG
jgi:hypothetical protein